MKFFKECKSRLQLVGGVLFSLVVLSSCNSEGGKESVQLSIGSDSSGSSSKWDKATIRSNYALLFKAEDYQTGLSLKEEFEKARSVLRLDDDYFTKLDFEDTSGNWIVQVRGYEEEDVSAAESVRYGVHQTGISGSFQFRESGVTEVKVKIRPAGKHFPITGQLAHQRSTGSSCAFQLSMSGEQTANVGSRGYIADLEIYDGEGKKLGEMSQSAMQFDLMDYADRVEKLKVSLKVKTADPETSEKLPMQEFQVNCDPFLIATLQTLQDSDNKTFALSPLLLKTQTPLVATQTPYDASHACSKQKGMLLVSKDNFNTCEPVDLTPTQDGQYLIIPKQSWNSNPVKYSLGVREKDNQAPTNFGLNQKTLISFEAGTQNTPSSAKGLALAIAGVKAGSELTLNSSGQYVYTPATADQCDAVKYQNKHDESFVASGNECQASAALSGLVEDITFVDNSRTLQISWKQVQGMSYNIYRSLSSSDSFTKIATNASTPYKDTSVDANKTYNYRLEFCQGFACSAQTDSLTASARRFVQNPKATQSSSDTANLSWAVPVDVSKIKHYKIYRQKPDGSWELIHTTTDASTTSWTDSGLTQAGSYQYRISAVSETGETYLTGVSLTLQTQPTAAPTGLAVVQVLGSETEAKLTWSAVTGATSYNIYRGTTSGSVNNLIHTVNDGSIISYTNTGLTKGTTYYYKVSAVNVIGESAKSVEKSVTLIEKSAAPTGLAVAQVVGSETQAKLTWNATTGANSYKIYRSTASGNVNTSVHTTADGSTTSYTDTVPTKGITYYYKISAINIAGESAKSVEKSVTLIERPTIPTIASASKEAIDTVKVVWNAASSASSYELYQATTTTASAFQVATTTTTATTYIKHDLPAGDYYYRVKGCNLAGCSALSAASSLVKIDISWAKATASAGWSARNGHSSVVFNGKIWIIGGSDGSLKNDVWSSDDGVIWTEVTASATTPRWSSRYGHSSVVFNGKIWVIGGRDGSNKNDVWSSDDGVNWTEVTASATTPRWSGRYSHSSVVFNDKIWVLGGNTVSRQNDVWSSDDGVIWTEVTASATTPRWSGRYSHSSLVFNDKIWVLGGYDGGNENDVWSSDDGVNWTEVTASATTPRWSGRYDHSSLVFNNRMWIVGGKGGSLKDDVWASDNGTSWTKATDSAAWLGRDYPSSVVFDNKIWVLGGRTSGATRKNDVWVSANASLVSKMQDPTGKAYGRSVLKLETNHTLVSQSTRGACSTTANTLLVSADGFVNCDAVFVKKGHNTNHVVIPKETWKLNATYEIGIMTSIGAKPVKDVTGNVLSFTTNNDTHDSTNPIKNFDVGGFSKLKDDDFHLDKDGKLWFYRNEGNTLRRYNANTCKNMFGYQNVNSQNFTPEITNAGGRTLAKDVLGSGSKHYLVGNRTISSVFIRSITTGSSTDKTIGLDHDKLFFYLCGVEIPDRSVAFF